MHITVEGLASEISIHALRKESDLCAREFQNSINISIHALRKESDHRPKQDQGLVGISIHALRKESDRLQLARRT